VSVFTHFRVSETDEGILVDFGCGVGGIEC